jgi:hypothetical protein
VGRLADRGGAFAGDFAVDRDEPLDPPEVDRPPEDERDRAREDVVAMGGWYRRDPFSPVSHTRHT